jgi:hypothetical protein
MCGRGAVRLQRPIEQYDSPVLHAVRGLRARVCRVQLRVVARVFGSIGVAGYGAGSLVLVAIAVACGAPAPAPSPARAGGGTARPLSRRSDASSLVVAPPPALPPIASQVDAFCMQLKLRQHAELDHVPEDLRVRSPVNATPVLAREWLAQQAHECMRDARIVWGTVAEHPRLIARAASRPGLDADVGVYALDASGVHERPAAGFNELRLGDSREVRLTAQVVVDVDGDGQAELLVRTLDVRGNERSNQVRILAVAQGRIVEHQLSAGTTLDMLAAANPSDTVTLPGAASPPKLIGRGPVRCRAPTAALDARRQLYVWRHDGRAYTLALQDMRERALAACPRPPLRLSDVPALDVECMKLWGVAESEIEAQWSAYCAVTPAPKACSDMRKKQDEFDCWVRAPIPRVLF